MKGCMTELEVWTREFEDRVESCRRFVEYDIKHGRDPTSTRQWLAKEEKRLRHPEAILENIRPIFGTEEDIAHYPKYERYVPIVKASPYAHIYEAIIAKYEAMADE